MLDPKKDIPTTLADSRTDANASSSANTEVPQFAGRHYSVAEVAGLWNLSPDYVRRIFEKEQGVLVLGNAKPARYKR
jgi:AraC-like DNA-binding protein